MELWELNICVKEYSKMQEEKAVNDTANAWQVANLTGAAFCGKLRKLEYYLRQMKTQKVSQAPKISQEEFDRKLAEAERRAKNVAEQS